MSGPQNITEQILDNLIKELNRFCASKNLSSVFKSYPPSQVRALLSKVETDHPNEKPWQEKIGTIEKLYKELAKQYFDQIVKCRESNAAIEDLQITTLLNLSFAAFLPVFFPGDPKASLASVKDLHYLATQQQKLLTKAQEQKQPAKIIRRHTDNLLKIFYLTQLGFLQDRIDIKINPLRKIIKLEFSSGDFGYWFAGFDPLTMNDLFNNPKNLEFIREHGLKLFTQYHNTNRSNLIEIKDFYQSNLNILWNTYFPQKARAQYWETIKTNLQKPQSAVDRKAHSNNVLEEKDNNKNYEIDAFLQENLSPQLQLNNPEHVKKIIDFLAIIDFQSLAQLLGEKQIPNFILPMLSQCFHYSLDHLLDNPNCKQYFVSIVTSKKFSLADDLANWSNKSLLSVIGICADNLQNPVFEQLLLAIIADPDRLDIIINQLDEDSNQSPKSLAAQTTLKLIKYCSARLNEANTLQNQTTIRQLFSAIIANPNLINMLINQLAKDPDQSPASSAAQTLLKIIKYCSTHLDETVYCDLFLRLGANKTCMNKHKQTDLEPILHNAIFYFTEHYNPSYSFAKILQEQDENIKRQLVLQQLLWTCGSVLLNDDKNSRKQYCENLKNNANSLKEDDFQNMRFFLKQTGKYIPEQIDSLYDYFVEKDLILKNQPEPCSQTRVSFSETKENKDTEPEISQSTITSAIAPQQNYAQFLTSIATLQHTLPQADNSWTAATHAKIIFGTLGIALIGYAAYLLYAFMRCLCCCCSTKPSQKIIDKNDIANAQKQLIATNRGGTPIPIKTALTPNKIVQNPCRLFDVSPKATSPAPMQREFNN